MKYENAQNVLPNEIIEIIQKYVDGSYLYIPRKDDNRKSWGENSGTKKVLGTRNKEMFYKYQQGVSIKELASSYFLTEPSVRRIIRNEKCGT